MSAANTIRRRGTPLALLAVLLGGWVFLRAATWDYPLADPALASVKAEPFAAPASTLQSNGAQQIPAPLSLAYPHLREYPPAGPYPAYGAYPYPAYPAHLPPGWYQAHTGSAPAAAQVGPIVYYVPYPQGAIPAAHNGYPLPHGQPPQGFALAPDLTRTGQGLGQGLRQGGCPLNWNERQSAGELALYANPQGKPNLSEQQARPLPGGQALETEPAKTDRWFLDAYGFYRQGSNSLNASQAPVSQARQPIYGASQFASSLQWRARPSSSNDPRLYARAYQALVAGGENEIAAGVSALPFGNVPVRLYGEVRAVRNPAATGQPGSPRTDFRPAAYLATELPPQSLPLGLSLEAYGAGGYVGGNASTFFFDGQAVATRPVFDIGREGVGSAKMSLGAGVWGGIQNDASRLDVGPTLRFDVDIGKMPARVSVDYREKVAGDAEPESGVAATVSTRF